MGKRRRAGTSVVAPAVVSINEVLDGHVALEVECVDRLYLNAYVPNLQVGGQVVRFPTEYLDNPIPTPALFEKIGNGFRREVKAQAARHGIPILALRKPDRTRWDDRKRDHVRPYLDAAERSGRYGLVAIVSAQELQWVSAAGTSPPSRERSATPSTAPSAAWGPTTSTSGPRARPRLHQNLHLPPVSRQGVGPRQPEVAA
jgi:hypothetical protein